MPELDACVQRHNHVILQVMSQVKNPSEAEILDRMIGAGDAEMTPEAAQALLQLKFDADASKAINRLLKANAAGTISTEDRLLLERYLRVGQLIDLVQAKARSALSQPQA